jgi:hypothetical protein
MWLSLYRVLPQWESGRLPVMPSSQPTSLVTMLSLMRVTWRGYAAPYTGLWVVADMHENNAY